MSQIVLFYPNASWRANIGDLASKEDKAFNWFLCAKRYKDPASGFYIAEISKKTKFYDKTTGATLVPSPDLEDPPKLLIVDDSDNEISKDVDSIIEKYKYQGTTSTKACRSSKSKTTPCDEDFLCQEASFDFLPGILILSTKEKTCPIIDYAKRNHKNIRKHIRNFPSPSEIDQVLEDGYRCSTVCRVLYQDLSEYFRLSKKV